jgi:predicted nucleic acid-binding protein
VNAAAPLAIDSTGWLARFIESDAHQPTVTAMSASSAWFASDLVLTESLVAIDRLGLRSEQRTRIENSMRLAWDRVHRIPVDARCLQRASEIARAHPVKLIDALHLAAADRVPRPTRFLTHEPAQIPVAMALGFEVVGAVHSDISRAAAPV